jgi:hypothetical protein
MVALNFTVIPPFSWVSRLRYSALADAALAKGAFLLPSKSPTSLGEVPYAACPRGTPQIPGDRVPSSSFSAMVGRRRVERNYLQFVALVVMEQLICRLGGRGLPTGKPTSTTSTGGLLCCKQTWMARPVNFAPPSRIGAYALGE